MTDLLIRNLSVARKPRSIKQCEECAEPCYPGMPRYWVQYFKPGAESTGYFHPQCLPKWMARFIREHRETLKPEKNGAK